MQASTSLGYSHGLSSASTSASRGYKASVFGSAASCLALVEVADGVKATAATFMSCRTMTLLLRATSLCMATNQKDLGM